MRFDARIKLDRKTASKAAVHHVFMLETTQCSPLHSVEVAR